MPPPESLKYPVTTNGFVVAPTVSSTLSPTAVSPNALESFSPSRTSISSGPRPSVPSTISMSSISWKLSGSMAWAPKLAPVTCTGAKRTGETLSTPSTCSARFESSCENGWPMALEIM